MRRRAARVLLFLLVVACWFVIFEVGLRQWGSSEAAPAFQGLFAGHPVLGYRLQPGARTRFSTSEFDTEITINNAGVRDDEEIGPKPSNERRVVILGDSLVLSVQVPFATTFGEQLEQRLNARAASLQDQTRYRVINAGVQGYGPVEEMLFFREVVRHLQPDVVLVSVFVGNDAEEAVTSQAKLLSERAAVDALRESVVTRLRRLVRRSMVLQILRLRLVAATSRFQPASASPEPPLQSYAARPAPRIAQGIAYTRDAIAQMSADAAAVGARLGIVLMPARLQLDDGDFGRLRDIVAAAGGEMQRHAPTERFASALSTLGLPMLDLLPPLQAALPGPDLFFQENVHLTPRGHGVVADALAGFVTDPRLMPAR